MQGMTGPAGRIADAESAAASPQPQALANAAKFAAVAARIAMLSELVRCCP